jgi:hypothetical protein
MPDVEVTSIITWPECGAATEAEIPIDWCTVFWNCPACDATLRPDSGDCRVFCSHGSVPCPPVQVDECGCSG